jgi:hypothetical protein
MLVFLVALAWVTGEAEGSLFVVHKLAGYGWPYCWCFA